MKEDLNAFEEALRRLSYRLYSTLEIKKHLLKKEYSEREIEEAINKLNGKKYLDDKEYVKNYVTGKGIRRLMSKKALMYELRYRVGNKEWLEELIDTFYEEYIGSENSVTVKLLEKKLKGKNYFELDKKEKNKIIKYILNKGFPYHILEKSLNSLYGDLD